MSALAIQFDRGGVFLPRLGLWLDAREPQPGPARVFVSHAHSDHTATHREVILTEPTARLMRVRGEAGEVENVLPWNAPAEFNGGGVPFRLTLLPAGHILGSAMARIEAGGESLLYSGDFKLRPGLAAEACDLSQAGGVETLIMETTFGRPLYQFPPASEVMQGVIRFCREALDNEETPVLFAYSLGKCQELLVGLAGAELPLMLHSAVCKITQVYQQFGFTFPAFEKFSPEEARGKVLLFPPGSSAPAALRKIGKTRSAILTGWAVDPNCRYRHQVDAAFPLSDHADFHELAEFVKRVAPKRVFTLHGFAADFAQTLREMGFDARALGEEEQLSLPLALGGLDMPAAVSGREPARGLPRGEAGENSAPSGGTAGEAAGDLGAAAGVAAPAAVAFGEFANVCAQAGATSKKSEKIRLLSDFLKKLAETELAAVAPWFTGHPFSPSEGRALQIGWALIRDALCAAGGLDQAAFGQVYLKHSDLGETAAEVLKPLPAPRAPLSIAAVRGAFEELHAARGPSGKLPVLLRALRDCPAREGRYLVKILTGDLRIGLKEGLVEEAIATAFDSPVEEVRQANLLLGNIGETAACAARKKLASASLTPFRPVKFMLASPEPDSEAIWKRVSDWNADLAEKTSSGTTLLAPEDWKTAIASAPLAWVEDKYDGIRCQLHKVGARVALYSRDLKEITATFPELVDAVQGASCDFVLDGEIVAMREGEVLPFSDLQKRLGRRENDLFLRNEIPAHFIAFDLLWLDGESRLDRSLKERRAALEAVIPPSLRLAVAARVFSAEDVELAFEDARARGNEGLMIKDPSSSYAPGRRGFAWLKLKRAFASLDCVVVGAEYGHGKRKELLSDYTFAVRDERTGGLKTIGKAFTGLTEAELEKLTAHFLGKVRSREGRYHAVEPDTVLEIAFDAVQPSSRHTSGLALRFPRIVRIRADKTADEIDTLAAARKLVQE